MKVQSTFYPDCISKTDDILLQFEIEKAMHWCDSLCSPLITDKVGWAAKP